MISIQGRRRPYRKCTSKDSSGSSLFPESSYDEGPVNPSTEPLVTKYTEENLQKILRTVLEARAPPSDAPCEKPLKARSSDVYCSKFHMECYNFYQQYENHFATAEAKGPNHISFAVFFLRDRINFRWQQFKRKYEAESTVSITWEMFKTFLCQSLGDSQAFIDSYWAKIKKDSQYQQEDVLDWATHLEHLQAVLQEFDSIAAPNKDTIIRYFQEGLRPSIQAQLDVKDRDLDSWDEVVDKTINAKAKASLQDQSGTSKIDFWCSHGQQSTKKDDKNSRDTKRISLPRIFLLMHYQVGPNLLWQSPRKTRTVVLTKENPKNRVKARILLPLVSTPLLSGKTRTRRRTRKTSLILSATLISRKAITPTSTSKKSQKTSVGLGNLHVGDWR